MLCARHYLFSSRWIAEPKQGGAVTGSGPGRGGAGEEELVRAALCPKTETSKHSAGDMQSGERFMQKVFCHQFTFRLAYHSAYVHGARDSVFIYLAGLACRTAR